MNPSSTSGSSSRQLSISFSFLLIFACLPLLVVYYGGPGFQFSEESIGYEPSESDVEFRNKDDSCEKSRRGATSGSRFHGLVINSFDASKFRFKNFTTSALDISDPIKREIDRLQCDKWSVVTTIFEPSDPLAVQAALPGW